MPRRSYVLFASAWLMLACVVCAVEACSESEKPTDKDTPVPQHSDGAPKSKTSRRPASMEIFVTAAIRGQLDECNCPGKRYTNLQRRASILRAKERRPILLLDAGSSLTEAGVEFNNERQRHLLMAYQDLGYDAVVPGRTEKTLQKQLLKTVTAGFESLFVCVNIQDEDTGQPYFQPYKIVDLGSSKVGVIGVSDPSTSIPTGFKLVDPILAIRPLLGELKKKADAIVVVGIFPAKLADRIAKELPEVTLVVTSTESFGAPATIRLVNNVTVFETGEIRSSICQLRLEFEPDTGKKMQPVYRILATDANTVVDRRVTQIVNDYKTKEYARIEGATSLPDPSTYSLLGRVSAETGWRNAYAGTASCGSCHTEEYDIWSQSAHSHAFQTLKSDGNDINNSCVRCHTVGFAESDGFDYENPRRTAYLVNVGCENCHGRGGLHAAIMEGKITPEQVQDYEFNPTPKASCVTCHDKANSPHFKFETYWAKIKHGPIKKSD